MNNYRKFFNEEEADALAEKLREIDIPAEVVYVRDSLDFIYGDKQFRNQYIVNIPQADFEKADKLMLTSVEGEVAEADPEHYLFTFSNEELMDVVAKPDEWNEFDYQLAQKILKQRGVVLGATDVDLLKKQRMAELAKPEKSNDWIFAGYVLACFGAFWGRGYSVVSVLGIFMGYIVMSYKKTLPTGERVYGYSASDRKHGVRIFFLGIFFFIVYWAYFYYKGSES